MFVFKSPEILTRENVKFSNGNMQAGSAILDGDAAFDVLNFRKIYHEGFYDRSNPDNSDIVTLRCSEVLCDSPLPLDHALEGVVCRSHAERQLLLYELGDIADVWKDKIVIHSKPGYFNADYAFVESVDLQTDGMSVRFHPRRYLPVESEVSAVVVSRTDILRRYTWPKQPLDLRKSWRFEFDAVQDSYFVEILIEDEVAYRSIRVFNTDPY